MEFECVGDSYILATFSIGSSLYPLEFSKSYEEKDIFEPIRREFDGLCNSLFMDE